MARAQPPEPYRGEFLRAVIGSTVHGLNLEATDDLDLMGVRVETMDEVVRLGAPFEQHVWRSAGGQNPSGPGDVDLTVYGLVKYLRLAVKGNPTIINLLFVPPEHRHVDTPLADELRSLTRAIVSREAAGRFLGYMKAQRERLEGVRGQKHTGANRKKFYVRAPTDDAPWDGKYGSHIIRLGYQGVELMETGRIEFPMAEPLRSKIRAVREGVYSKASVLRWAEALESNLLAFRDGRCSSPLQAHPAVRTVEGWMRATYLKAWMAAADEARLVAQTRAWHETYR